MQQAITVEPSLGPERHQREQAKQHRRGARDGQLGPSTAELSIRSRREPARDGGPVGPLGLDPEMPAHFRERHLDRPAPHEPAEHVERISIRVGAQEALRPALARTLAHQEPSMPAASIRSRRDRRPQPAKGIGTCLPGWYQSAVPEIGSICRSVRPCQPVTVTRRQPSRPSPTSPRDRSEQHDRKPAQAAGHRRSRSVAKGARRRAPRGTKWPRLSAPGRGRCHGP